MSKNGIGPRPLAAVAALAAALWSGGQARADTVPVMVIHGGAGVIKADMSVERQQIVKAALDRALQAGYTALKAGQPAKDAVVAAIRVLEDDPNFNAGKGAVFTHDRRNEMDAAIMDGATLQAGAVAGVAHVRNPITLARAVMEHSQHVLLIGDGAEAFAVTQKIPLVDSSYFWTQRRWDQLQKALKEDAAHSQHADETTDRHFGTVGAVALDRAGHLAAGTSTGGMTDKLWGRVGDSPLIGAGTYANAGCAMSGTGWGEFYIRTVAAHEICMRVTMMHEALDHAAQDVINHEIPALGGDGGAILVDAQGDIAMPFNTSGMYRAWVGRDGVSHVAIFGDGK
ncbi:isoaspartyl peptidase/L-asparaginase family protein [Gluconacetobacter takamatsuzukensis]|uniref:Isoaspartyl peptidase n=1 Tax=Gluconacetobacter takamatsuzukensis TaxID=1286190 RepID=A0A7W4KDT2_9PROT|nr:isoaspartyl peptidase/L-asparaginase [Gluconacetobacter takamatsuzukensis]MBB2205041.1 isoaspartyl peptidase/L-asparaginase [Gluconacetobacter takamatsuzukensis]